MGNLKKMDRFLENNLPRWNGEEIEIITTQLQAMKLSCDQKSPKKQKPQTRWFDRRILPNIYTRANAYPSKTLSKNCRGRNTSKLILQGHHTLIPKPDKDNKHTQKLQANITDEHRCKSPQQNFIKQNSATHLKSYTP